MAGDAKKLQPIIVKRVQKGGHGHHGGAWKIAYADFVTAMMAFFLLMWLLGSTTDGDKKGIADYFQTPLKIALLASGSGAGDASHVIRGGGEDMSRSAGQVTGWAALSPVSKRPVYAGVAEVSIYIAEEARGQGTGRALLLELIKESEQAGLWTLQASIFAENAASQALHAACGFRLVGRRERIAQRDGVWHDTVLMEKRSSSQ